MVPGQSGGSAGTLGRSWHRSDDEHGLIARYTAKLAESQTEIGPAPEKHDGSSAHQLLAQLEVKNQEILREIARIRYGETTLRMLRYLDTSSHVVGKNKSWAMRQLLRPGRFRLSRSCMYFGKEN